MPTLFVRQMNADYKAVSVVTTAAPPCDGAWPEDQVAKFKSWMDEGMAP